MDLFGCTLFNVSLLSKAQTPLKSRTVVSPQRRMDSQVRLHPCIRDHVVGSFSARKRDAIGRQRDAVGRAHWSLGEVSDATLGMMALLRGTE